MESFEVLKQAVDEVGAKYVASEMGLSTSLVYKWCERPPEEDGDASGARNPLDRVASLMGCTKRDELPSWVCEQAGGFFVRNPEVRGDAVNQEFIARTQRIIQDFSELLAVVSQSMADDNRIDREEAGQIRRKWQSLKQYGEEFVCACELGMFA
jgi:hypothetical protein